MAETAQIVTRDDLDIREDILTIIVKYPPTNNDRKHIDVAVEGGAVTISGHVMSPINRRYLAERAAQVEGVTSVNVDALYDDENIRLDAGRLVPTGVLINVTYGNVVVSGTLPEGADASAIAEAISAMPGVKRVVMRFF